MQMNSENHLHPHTKDWIYWHMQCLYLSRQCLSEWGVFMIERRCICFSISVAVPVERCADVFLIASLQAIRNYSFAVSDQTPCTSNILNKCR